MFSAVTICRALERDGRLLKVGDTLTVGAVEAAAMIRDRVAVPAGCVLAHETQRPIVGAFVPRSPR